MSESKLKSDEKINHEHANIRWMLVVYDLLVYAVSAFLLLFLYGGNDSLTHKGLLQHLFLSLICIFGARFIWKIYTQVWRYGGIQGYIRLLMSDGCAFIAYFILQMLLPVEEITFSRLLSLICVNLLGALAIRMIYSYAYRFSNQETKKGRFLSKILKIFSGMQLFIMRGIILMFI